MKTRQSGMFLVEENTFCVIKHTETNQASFVFTPAAWGGPAAILL